MSLWQNQHGECHIDNTMQVVITGINTNNQKYHNNIHDWNKCGKEICTCREIFCNFKGKLTIWKLFCPFFIYLWTFDKIPGKFNILSTLETSLKYTTILSRLTTSQTGEFCVVSHIPSNSCSQILFEIIIRKLIILLLS